MVIQDDDNTNGYFSNSAGHSFPPSFFVSYIFQEVHGNAKKLAIAGAIDVPNPYARPVVPNALFAFVLSEINDNDGFTKTTIPSKNPLKLLTQTACVYVSAKPNAKLIAATNITDTKILNLNPILSPERPHI